MYYNIIFRMMAMALKTTHLKMMTTETKNNLEAIWRRISHERKVHE